MQLTELSVSLGHGERQVDIVAGLILPLGHMPAQGHMIAGGCQCIQQTRAPCRVIGVQRESLPVGPARLDGLTFTEVLVAQGPPVVRGIGNPFRRLVGKAQQGLRQVRALLALCQE